MEDHQAEVVVESPPLPAADEYRVEYNKRELNVPLTIEYLHAQRLEMITRVALIEETLGFVASSADLAIRVARIEAFLGIK